MSSKSAISVLFFTVLVFCFNPVEGQQTPLNPVSYYIFTPFIYNPAIAGSKDFSSIGFTAAFQGESNTQLLSGNGRLTRKSPGYFATPMTTEYTNSGIGGSVYRDLNGLSKNIGISGSYAYHIPLNSHKLSYLSFGTSIKGSYSTISSDSIEPDIALQKKFYPNFDLGVYYYGPGVYAGISAVNLLGSPWIPDTLGNYDVPVSRQYFFTGGIKILLSRTFNIVLEPSVLVSATDSTFGKIGDNITPILKIYLENFCLGSSYNSYNDGTISVFGQFRYPSFYVGAYYEFNNKTAYYKSKPNVEFTFGINIRSDKTRLTKHIHW